MCQIHISLSEDNINAKPLAPALQPVVQFPFGNCDEGFKSDSDAFSATKIKAICYVLVKAESMEAALAPDLYHKS